MKCINLFGFFDSVELLCCLMVESRVLFIDFYMVGIGIFYNDKLFFFMFFDDIKYVCVKFRFVFSDLIGNMKCVYMEVWLWSCNYYDLVFWFSGSVWIVDCFKFELGGNE